MSDLRQALLEKGIDVPGLRFGTNKVTCPKCSHTRKKKNDPCLWVNMTDDYTALWKCYNCNDTGAVNLRQGTGKRESNYETRKEREYKKPEAKPESEGWPKFAVDFLAARKISVATCEKQGVTYSKGSFHFPLLFGGEIINIKHRRENGKDSKGFSLEKDARLIFYGLDNLKGASECIIVEGEFDALAMIEAGITNVISVPNGHSITKNKEDKPVNAGKFEYLAHAEEVLRGMKRIILCVDNDAVGHDLEFELARRIGRERCWRVRMPKKDANDVLIELGADALREAMMRPLPYPIEGLYHVSDFDKEIFDFYREGIKRGLLTGWENVDRFYSVMPGQLTVVTGVPNSGKSEWLDALLVNLARKYEQKFAIYSPENTRAEHVIKLAEKFLEKPASEKSQRRMTESDLKDGAYIVSKYFFFLINESQDGATLDWILEKTKTALLRYGVNGLVIDPYNWLDHRRPNGMNETDYISKFLSKVKTFAKANDIHVWIVAHPSKMEKDKKGKTLVPSLYDISGSAHWVNKTDNGIVVDRQEGEGEADVLIHLKKVRSKHVGRKGIAKLEYDLETGTYETSSEEKTYVNSEGQEVKYSAYSAKDSNAPPPNYDDCDDIPF